MREQIEALEAQLRQRLDQMAAADPMCQRIQGRLDVYRELTQDAREDLELEVVDGTDDDSEDG